MSEGEGAGVAVKEPLRASDLDRGFRDEVMRRHGGEKLNLCYQCGSCSGGCPVGKITDSYRPREIIRMTLLGLRDEVLSSGSIWLCASCYTCQERCPQGVEIADLMLALRNIAASEGHAPKALVDQASALLENGRMLPISGLAEKRRTELGLPAVPPTSVEAVKKIAAKTGFELEKLRGGQG